MTELQEKISVTPYHKRFQQNTRFFYNYLGKNKESESDSGINRFFAKDISVWLINNQNESRIDVSTNINDLIIHFLSKTPEVKQIFILKEAEDMYKIWIVVSEKTEDIKKKIREQERKMIRYFKESLFFDFYILNLEESGFLKNTDVISIFEK